MLPGLRTYYVRRKETILPSSRGPRPRDDDDDDDDEVKEAKYTNELLT